MFAKKTVRDIDLKNKTVLLHGEFDAPLTSDGKNVTSDFRIRSVLPTIKYLQEQNCRIILVSKLGRPGGRPDSKQSLRPVAACLAAIIGQDVQFVPDCVGRQVRAAVKSMPPSGLLMLENLRFHPEEEQNDQAFAQKLADDSGAEVFVQDCFSLVHRQEAITDAITHCLPSVAGLHLEEEIVTIIGATEHPARPLVTIVGGAKISDKIGTLAKFVEIADCVVVGGAIANVFLTAQGYEVGQSHFTAADLKMANAILTAANKKMQQNDQCIFYIAQDGIAAKSLNAPETAHVVSWSIADPGKGSQIVADGESIFDVGPLSSAYIANKAKNAGTVIWNGTLGVTEVQTEIGVPGPFARGTETLITALIGKDKRPYSLVCGGDTSGYIEQRKLTSKFNHVSTGGGSSLELLAGHKLPGIEALADK
ncbi:MAG TPA: phosphoglycerate kinase [Patescibacteria group bacterium]|nr:phosphoglycerate kinase [Patescibacteria group bacterium]